MADSIMNIDIQDLKEVQKKMEQMTKDITGGPMLNAIRIGTLLVQSSAKKNLKAWKSPGGPDNAGVDTGRMRASITPSVSAEKGLFTRGIVGSNVEYAPYQEYGTKPHFVSAKNMGNWPKRHGLKPGPVFVSGKALKYLGRALETSREKIKELIESALEAIARK